MTKLMLKTSLVIILSFILLIGGYIGSIERIAKNIEPAGKEISDFQVQSLEIPRNSENTAIPREIRSKVETTLSYIEHAPIIIDGNTDFNDTANQEGWLGNGTIDNPFIIQGLNITGQSGDSLIQIQNTNVYFQINASHFQGGTAGIYLENVVNGSIINNTILLNMVGVYLYQSNNNSIFNNSISNSSLYGIALEYSGNNTLFNNTLHDGSRGIYVSDSKDNTLSNNTFMENSMGMEFYGASGNNKIVNNTFINDSFLLRGSQFSDYIQSEVSNNVINGKPLLYWLNKTAEVLPTDVGQIILVNCHEMNVTNYSLFNCDVGLITVYCSELMISDNFFSNVRYGIQVVYLSQSTILNNTFVGSSSGLSLTHAENNIIRNNFIDQNNGEAVRLSYTIDCQFSHNFISDSGQGIFLHRSAYNTIFDNLIYKISEQGLYIDYSDHNTIFLNSIINCTDYGIYMIYSTNTTVCSNNFLHNAPTEASQGLCFNVDPSTSNNLFDLNFWNDWVQPDLDNDNIVDNPYFLDNLIPPYLEDLHPVTSPSLIATPTIIYPNGAETLKSVVNLRWSHVVDRWGYVVSYSVQYSADNGSTWNQIPSAINLTANSFLWDTTGVPDGTEYLLKIVAAYSYGLIVEHISDSIFTIQNAILSTPSIPQSVTATAGEMFVYLTWTAPNNDGGSAITGYRVYRGTINGEYTVLFITSDTNYNDTLVNGDVTYYYIITAINAVGESIASTEVSTTPTEPTVSTTTTTPPATTLITITSVIYETTWITQTKATTEFATLAIFAGFLGVLWLKRRKKK